MPIMLLRSLLAAAAFVAVTNAATVTFTNTRRFLFDVDGDQIDAYGSKINCEPQDFSVSSFNPLLTFG